MTDDEQAAQRPGVLTRQAAGRLQSAGLPSAMADARTLLAHVLHVEPVALAMIHDVPPEKAEVFRQLVARRAHFEPLQHLTGEAWFRGWRLVVGPGVFIPRPETEGLVQLAIDWLAGQGVANPPVVDLGTGSGAIALALARETNADVYAVEASDAAYDYARRNVGTQVCLRYGSWDHCYEDLDGQAMAVVCNPPYVPTGAELPPDVAGYDPPEALFAGDDGLDAIRQIVPVAARLLRPGGLLVFEHDDSQGASAPAVVAADGRFTTIADHVDLAGRARYVTALRDKVIR